jgi:hypothetical protein
MSGAGCSSPPQAMAEERLTVAPIPRHLWEYMERNGLLEPGLGLLRYRLESAGDDLWHVIVEGRPR